MPTTGTIKKETKLSRQKIHKHLSSGLKAKYKTLVQGKIEIMAIKAL